MPIFNCGSLAPVIARVSFPLPGHGVLLRRKGARSADLGLITCKIGDLLGGKADVKLFMKHGPAFFSGVRGSHWWHPE